MNLLIHSVLKFAHLKWFSSPFILTNLPQCICEWKYLPSLHNLSMLPLASRLSCIYRFKLCNILYYPDAYKKIETMYVIRSVFYQKKEGSQLCIQAWEEEM